MFWLSLHCAWSMQKNTYISICHENFVQTEPMNNSKATIFLTILSLCSNTTRLQCIVIYCCLCWCVLCTEYTCLLLFMRNILYERLDNLKLNNERDENQKVFLLFFYEISKKNNWMILYTIISSTSSKHFYKYNNTRFIIFCYSFRWWIHLRSIWTYIFELYE